MTMFDWKASLRIDIAQYIKEVGRCIRTMRMVFRFELNTCLSKFININAKIYVIDY
jgi:hypothetical protein